ncbi:MAG: tRNA-dihydrouridine synthase [Planctomycetes bacterium]|nr:tRNA-dihydrouridine synthase [Planctomycetota bacterium]
MSVELELEREARHDPRRIETVARAVAVDPRIGSAVPGFDAPFFQAGLAGFSDGAMRILARRRGAPFCVTEAMLDRFLIGREANSDEGAYREDPDTLADRLVDESSELHDHPIAGQLMGSDPDEMAAAAARLVELGYDVIDVNFACPVKKIHRKSRGGHFLAAPYEATQVLRAVREAVPATVPTTVKLRRAYDDSDEMQFAFEVIFDRAYELGFAWVTVHARTVVQKYRGPSRWEALAELTRRYPDRLIFGSGDIATADDIFAMIEATGVHAVSVARGGIGNPWIFEEARALMAGGRAPEPTIEEQRDTLLEHLRLSRALHGDWLAPRFMRKFVAKFAARHPAGVDVRRELVRAESVEEWRRVVDRWYVAGRE